MAGSRPAPTEAAASAGLNESVMSISPSLSSWRCAEPLSGKLLALAPQRGLELVVPGPQRRGDLREARVGGRHLQHRRIGDQVDQRLLQKGRPEEVADLRMREPAGMASRPLQHRRRGARQLRRVPKARRVVHEDDLRQAPRHRQAIDRRREVDQVGALVGHVHVLEVRQRLRDRAVQQPLLLHGEEVRPVDPDQVDRAALVAAGRFLRDHAGHGLGGVLEARVDQVHAVARLDLLADPGDEGIGFLVARPGIPVDGLAACLAEDRLPGRGRLRHGPGRGQERGGEKGEVAALKHWGCQVGLKKVLLIGRRKPPILTR